MTSQLKLESRGQHFGGTVIISLCKRCNGLIIVDATDNDVDDVDVDNDNNNDVDATDNDNDDNNNDGGNYSASCVA